MEVFIVPNEGDEFEIEIGYFDSMLEMKEKIEKEKGIATSEQTLVFNGKVLEDDLDILNSDIFIGSRIQLFVSPNTINNVMEMDEPRTPLTLSNAFGGEDYKVDLSEDEEFDINLEMSSALKMFIQENEQELHGKSSALELEMVLQEIELYTDLNKSSALKMVLQEYEQELHGNHPMKGSTSTRPSMMTSLSPETISLSEDEELHIDLRKSSDLKMVLQENEQELHDNHPMKGSTSTGPSMMASLSPETIFLSDDEELHIDLSQSSALEMFLQENEEEELHDNHPMKGSTSTGPSMMASFSPETFFLSDDEELLIDLSKSFDLEKFLQENEQEELHDNHPMKGSTSTRPSMMTGLSPRRISLFEDEELDINPSKRSTSTMVLQEYEKKLHDNHTMKTSLSPRAISLSSSPRTISLFDDEELDMNLSKRSPLMMILQENEQEDKENDQELHDNNPMIGSTSKKPSLGPLTTTRGPSVERRPSKEAIRRPSKEARRHSMTMRGPSVGPPMEGREHLVAVRKPLVKEVTVRRDPITEPSVGQPMTARGPSVGPVVARRRQPLTELGTSVEPPVAGRGPLLSTTTSGKPLQEILWNKLKLTVITNCEPAREIKVEVTSGDLVSAMRSELLIQGFKCEKYHTFTYNKRFLDDHKTFGWHRVPDGGIIHIFKGAR